MQNVYQFKEDGSAAGIKFTNNYFSKGEALSSRPTDTTVELLRTVPYTRQGSEEKLMYKISFIIAWEGAYLHLP